MQLDLLLKRFSENYVVCKRLKHMLEVEGEYCRFCRFRFIHTEMFRTTGKPRQYLSGV